MARDPDEPVDRSLRPNPLAWTGAAPSRGGAGFVASVGMNAPKVPKLAVDPEGTVPPPARPGSKPPPGARGPQVAVSPIVEAPDPRERPSGRFKLPQG